LNIKNYLLQQRKKYTATLKNMHFNTKKYLLQQKMYYIKKKSYCNISSCSTATLQKHQLQ